MTWIQKIQKWFNEEKLKGNYVFYCKDCKDFVSIDENTYNDAKHCLECENCGKLSTEILLNFDWEWLKIW